MQEFGQYSCVRACAPLHANETHFILDNHMLEWECYTGTNALSVAVISKNAVAMLHVVGMTRAGWHVEWSACVGWWLSDEGATAATFTYFLLRRKRTEGEPDLL
jgi:hypothetical protein